MSACYISSGVACSSCDVSTGGIRKVYIVGGGTVTGFTYDANDQITGVTATTGTTVFEFCLKRGVSSLTQTITKSYENATLFYEQVLNIVLYKMDTNKRNQILLMAVNDFLQIIAEDNNGVLYWLGETNGMSLSGSAGTGTGLGDRNGFELTFTGQEPQLASILSPDLATVLGSIPIA